MEIRGTAIATGVLTPTVATEIPDVDKVRANAVVITVATQPVRMRMTGAAPTAALGHLLAVGEHYFRGSQIVRDIKFIDTAAGASAVTYTTLR